MPRPSEFAPLALCALMEQQLVPIDDAIALRPALLHVIEVEGWCPWREDREQRVLAEAIGTPAIDESPETTVVRWARRLETKARAVRAAGIA